MSVFCLHCFALSTNPRIIPAEISRYRLLSMSVSLISRQPMKLQISFGFARAVPTTNPRTGMLWERDCLSSECIYFSLYLRYLGAYQCVCMLLAYCRSNKLIHGRIS